MESSTTTSPSPSASTSASDSGTSSGSPSSNVTVPVADGVQNVESGPAVTVSVWSHFDSTADKTSAKCKICKKTIQTKNGGTSGLHKHLRNIHYINTEKKECKKNSEPERQTGSKITSFCHGTSKLPEARMTAKDGLAFRLLETSTDLRQGLIARGFTDLPKCRKSAKKLVMDYSTQIREQQKNRITALKNGGKKFSLTLDEWTSTRNRRYVNINIHSSQKEFWNLGLVPVKGSLTSTACLSLIKKKLESYNIQFDCDIVCITTDGPSVMVKLGKIAPSLHQLCYAHGIQLAVLDVLYKKPVVTSPADVADDQRIQSEDSEDEDINSSSLSESDASSEAELDIDDEETIVSPRSAGLEVADDWKALFDKVRKTVKLFKKSPLKFEKLQDHMRRDLNKEFSLILDCKTRWGSLLNMLERFLELKSCIQKALIDLKINWTFEEADFGKISEVVNALKPISVAVEALCRNDANLITADAVLKFTLGKLVEANTSITKKLEVCLKKRIKERRTNISGVLQFLHTGKIATADCDLFQKLLKKDITVIIKDLVVRLLPESSSNDAEEFSASDKSNDIYDMLTLDSQPEPKRKRTQLQIEMDQVIAAANMSTHKEHREIPRNLLSTIQRELGLFENGGAKGYHLQLVYDWLMSIQPTSVESERAFSSAGSICTKIRSRLADDTLGELCFLRSHFRNLEKIRL